LGSHSIASKEGVADYDFILDGAHSQSKRNFRDNPRLVGLSQTQVTTLIAIQLNAHLFFKSYWFRCILESGSMSEKKKGFTLLTKDKAAREQKASDQDALNKYLSQVTYVQYLTSTVGKSTSLDFLWFRELYIELMKVTQVSLLYIILKIVV
jgi:hypothetical protein